MEGVLADALVITHAGYLIYLVLGGFLALWRRWLVWPHLIAMAWAVFVVTFSVDCPLTSWEVTLREMAGEATYTGPFIDHYIEGVVYPDGYTMQAQIVAMVVIITSYVLVVRLRLHTVREDWPGST